jgi:hypothetical protein
MKRALVVVAMPLLVWACGGDAGGEKPPQTAGDASVAPAEPPTDPTAKTDNAGDAASGAKPAGDAKPGDSGEEAWAGESEAKAQKAPDAGGKAETRTMEVIAQVIKDNRKGVRDCFEKAKKDLPDLKGDMVIHFVIDPDGKVKKADLNQERSTLKSPAVVDCSIKVVSAIKFPPSSRGMDTTVNYPFNLN